ncbi:MAG: hypothetical protein AB1Z18_01620 [Desulfobacterales bacterium]|jgi:hypothetical protein
MNRYLCQSILGCTLVITLLVVGPIRASEVETATDYTDEACIECHRMGSEESDRHINVDEYQASVHGQELTCQDCHTGVVDDTHQSEVGAGAVDCGDCHEQENRHGLNGPEEQRPKCHDCHTRHHMLSKTDPASAVHPDQLATTCAGCHPAASGETDFFSWFPSYQIASHNKGDFATAYNKDNCLGCHQGAAVHGESAPIDEQDCYKCHLSPDAAGAMWGYIHPKPDIKTQPIVFAAASIYQVFVAFGLIVLLGKFLNLVFDRFLGKSK